MKKAIVFTALIFASITSFAWNCKLVTSEPLRSQQQVLDVKGRQGLLIKQKLSFGQFHTTSVKRSWITKWTGMSGFVGLVWTEHMKGKQSIRFNLTNGTDASEVIAVTNVASNDLVIGSNPQSLPNQVSSVLRIGTENQTNNYSVAIYTNKNEEPWQLFLDNTNAQLRREQYIGFVSRGNEYYSIVPVWTVQKKNGKTIDLPFGAAGFEIVNEKGEACAAVSLVDNGEVYMGNLGEQEKFLMANICAALLLQSNINE